jgi:hypothetical protein
MSADSVFIVSEDGRDGQHRWVQPLLEAGRAADQAIPARTHFPPGPVPPLPRRDLRHTLPGSATGCALERCVRVLDRLNAAGIPATPLHGVEPVVDGPCLIRLEGGARLERVRVRWCWSPATPRPGRGAGSPARRAAGSVCGWPPGGRRRRWLIRACRSSGCDDASLARMSGSRNVLVSSALPSYEAMRLTARSWASRQPGAWKLKPALSRQRCRRSCRRLRSC